MNYHAFTAKLLRIFLLVGLIMAGFMPRVPIAHAQSTEPEVVFIDLSISLYRETVAPEMRANYERLIEYFADGVYEASNGANKVRTVRIYTNNRFADKANVLWVESCHPNSPVAAYYNTGQHLNMCDKFGGTDFLSGDTGWQQGGYTLAHEWGHYYYSLWDEYRSTDASYNSYPYMPHTTDTAVSNSMMNSQWNAVGGSDTAHLNWLNFSTKNNIQQGTAQFRVYQASAWETLVRPLKDDPRDDWRSNQPVRLYHPELAAVAPGENDSPRIDLAGTSRSDLNIIWMDERTDFFIVIDRSDSMIDAGKVDSAKTAAMMLVDLAEIDKTSIGVIMFSEYVELIQPLTPIDSLETKANIKAVIANITPYGYTAVGDAAQLALDQLLSSQTSNASRAVFLLTDGMSNSGVDPLSVIPAYAANSIPLFTFAYGGDAETLPLQQMASGTNGKFYYSPTTLAELTKVFLDANQQISSNMGLKTGSMSVPANSAQSVSIPVDSALSNLSLVVTHNAAPEDVSFVFIDPNGYTVPITPTCSYSNYETMCNILMENVQSGEWRLAMQTSLDEVWVTYRVDGTPGGGIPLYANVTSLTGGVVQYPQPIQITASANREYPIAGLVAQATVQLPDGSETTLILADDGVAPDYVANDGIYSALLNYTYDGAYNITVTFTNPNGSAVMTNLSYAPSIGPNGETYPTENIPVTEKFERFARTQVNVVGTMTDDHSNSFDYATTLYPDNTNVAGKIDYADDVDMFSVTPYFDGKINIRITDLAFQMDPLVKIYSEDRTTVLAEARLGDAGGAGYILSSVEVKSGDTLYIEVRHNGDTAGGLYNISAGPMLTSDNGIQQPGGGGGGLWIVLAVAGVVLVGGGILLAARKKRPSTPPLAVTGGSAQLIFVGGPFAGYASPLVNGCIVGSAATANLRLNDPGVSPQHARLIFHQGLWFIQDMGSYAGCYVNGIRVSAIALKNGDRLRIGMTEFFVRL